MSKRPLENHPFFASPQRTAKTSHALVSYRKLGTGPAVLFLHGWPLHGATYRDVAARLADRYTCYVIDLPGAGSTPGFADWKHPMRSHTDTVIEVIDALGLERVALIGHDSGGAIARWVAAELGERISALVLSDTEITGHVLPMIKRLARFLKVPGSLFLLRLLFSSRRLRRTRFGFGGGFHDRDLIDGDFHDLFIAPVVSSRARFEQTMQLIANVDLDELADLGPVHARIHTPTRFVWGEKDPFFPVSRARNMGQELSHFDRLIVIPNAKVLAHEEYPEIFAAAAAGLLDQAVPRIPQPQSVRAVVAM